jgi:hypothetical protein
MVPFVSICASEPATHLDTTGGPMAGTVGDSVFSPEAELVKRKRESKNTVFLPVFY